jgi:hypothetical protein
MKAMDTKKLPRFLLEPPLLPRAERTYLSAMARLGLRIQHANKRFAQGVTNLDEYREELHTAVCFAGVDIADAMANGEATFGDDGMQRVLEVYFGRDCEQLAFDTLKELDDLRYGLECGQVVMGRAPWPPDDEDSPIVEPDNDDGGDADFERWIDDGGRHPID